MIGVVLIVLVGIFSYLFATERKLNRLEKELKKLHLRLNNLRDLITQLEKKYNKIIKILKKNNEIFTKNILGLYRAGRKFKDLEKDAIIETKNGKEYIKPGGIDAILKLRREDKKIQEMIDESKKNKEELENMAGDILEEIETKELEFHQLYMELKNSEK